MPPQKATNNSAESDKLSLNYEEIPSWARILFICLQPPILIINLYAIFLLFKSGNEAVGATAGLIALVGDIVAFVFFYIQKTFDISKVAMKVSPTLFLLAGPLIVLVASVFGYRIIFKIIARHEFYQAVTTREFVEANQSLFAAETLHFAVEDNLLSEFVSSLENMDNDNALWIAKLYRENRYSVDSASLALIQILRDAAKNKNERQAQKLAEVLIYLDPVRSATLAQEFNDASVIARSSNPPNRTLARIYLEIVKTIDESPSVEKSRSSFERSISLYSLAQMLEDDNPQEAIKTYRQAIRVDDTNIDAHYGLSSFLLTHHRQDVELLTEAVNLASTGLQRINSRFCRGTQDLQSEDTLHDSWLCFLLLTTEAGARFERGDESQFILPLLERAISLAEQNNHFGPGFYTAEPYYYLAQLSEPNPPKKVLCQIIILRNRNIPRHQEWALYAKQLLGGQQCP